jgi:large subunit ribosomal protein L17
VIHFIEHGILQTTKAKVKEVQKLTEKIVTIAGKGSDFNVIRRIKTFLPYSDKAVTKMIKEIAPRYVGRPGGYTRVIPLGQRESDTAKMARLEWV